MPREQQLQTLEGNRESEIHACTIIYVEKLTWKSLDLYYIFFTLIFT